MHARYRMLGRPIVPEDSDRYDSRTLRTEALSFLRSAWWSDALVVVPTPSRGERKGRSRVFIDLLPAALSSKQDITLAIVLVVGTGSVAMSYKRDGNEFQRISRAGGWGRLLGDDGSGYATGREGIRKTLRYCHLHRLKKSIGAKPPPFPPLSKAILEHFQAMYPNCNAENLLSTLLIPGPALHGQEDDDLTRTKNIASAASVVLSMATEDIEAKQIVESGAANVAELVKMLVKEQDVDVTHCALVLGGGLMGDSVYKELVLSGLEMFCGRFGHVESVGQPVIAGARHLLGFNQN